MNKKSTPEKVTPEQGNFESQLIPAGSAEREGRDEMNLVEYPPFTLNTGPARPKVIDVKWQTPHPNLPSKTIEARWYVVGHSELGLPTPQDELVYLALMEITFEQGWPQEVRFSKHSLLKRLNWPANAKYYSILESAFARLKAVSVTATNCFYDNTVKGLKSTEGFSLLDNYGLTDEKRGRKGQGNLPACYFRWNNVIYQSMRANYVRPIDLDFALSLDRPLALRLVRYLEKKRYYRKGKRPFKKRIYSEGIHNLCYKHLGMAEAKYASTLKSRLSPAHDELLRRGYLTSFEYLPMSTQDGERVRYTFGEKLLPKTAAIEPTNNDQAQGESAQTPSQGAQEPQREVQGLAREYQAIYNDLQPEERTALLEEAKTLAPDWQWEYLEDPERLVSLSLWELVERDYGDRLHPDK
jgi:hypothetical protein